jgi:hypothetical protein
MIKLKDILTEKFEIDLEVGDTILRGKFKNKPVIVKSFGTDDKGQPTINGKKMLSFRIKKLMPKKESVNEGVPMPTTSPNEFAYLDFKKWAYKKRGKIKKQMASLSPGNRERALVAVWELWDKLKNKKAYSNIKDYKKFGKVLYDMMKKDRLVEKKNK